MRKIRHADFFRQRMMRPRREDSRFASRWLLATRPAPAVLAASILILGAPLAAAAQEPAAADDPAARPPFHLATLFDLGHLVLDENGDGVPDRLGATLILAPDPTDAERAAAAEIAARLGFETMALDLPLRRGPRPGQIGILIGNRAVVAAGLSREDFGMGDPGPAGVATLTTASGEHWLAVFGDGPVLLRAARFLAGSLPHVTTLSGPSLHDITDDLVAWIATSDTTAPTATVTLPRVLLDDPGPGVHLVADLAAGTPAATLDRLQLLAWERLGDAALGPATDDLRFAGLSTLTVTAGARQVVLPTNTLSGAAAPSGPRPGAGAKSDLDLSSIYTTDGFLGGGDIPDRVDVVFVPGSGAEGVAELAARTALETTGLTVPIVRQPDEIEAPASEPTMVLVGHDHPLIAQLVDSGKVAPGDLEAGHGLIEVVDSAFGGKPGLVVTGADAEGAALATRRLAQVFPRVSLQGKERAGRDGLPTLDDVEHELWGTLSGRTPAGQAAIGLYKLDRIVAELTGGGGEGPAPGAPQGGSGIDAGGAQGEASAAGRAGLDLARAEVLLSVEKAPDGLDDYVRALAEALGADELAVTIDNRDVQNAESIFDDAFDVPSEVDRFWTVFDERIAGRVAAGAAIMMEARLSEPPEIRRRVADEARRRLIEAGADPAGTRVQVLSAFKQGFSWLRESVGPRLEGHEIGEIVVEFLRNEPPEAWPQQAMHTPLRWLHEIFPIDEVLAADLGLAHEVIQYKIVDEGPTYRVRASAPDGSVIVDETFDPVWVLRPYFDRFDDYEQVRVTTGWITATSVAPADTLVHERIVTDPEWFWDRYQSRTLPAVYDYVMDRHRGNPRGGGTDAPFFGTLTVELEMSEPDYRLDIDNEIIAPMDALHEEVYFGTIEFFHLLGRNARGQDLTYPGRIIPVMRPKGDGSAGRGRITFTGFATDQPAVVVRYETRDGERGERRLDIPKIAMERPSLRRAVIAHESPALGASGGAGEGGHRDGPARLAPDPRARPPGGRQHDLRGAGRGHRVAPGGPARSRTLRRCAGLARCRRDCGARRVARRRRNKRQRGARR